MSSIFDALDKVTEAIKPAEPDPVKPVVKDIPRGSIFVFDLETVPDETRFPRPVKPEKIVKPDVEGLDLIETLKGTAEKVNKILPSLSIRNLENLRAAEMAGKNRDGVLKGIASYLLSDDSQFESEYQTWRNLSFDVFACRIVALGIEARGHSVTMVAKNEAEERELIACLWEHIDKFSIRCGYNITAFDDAVLIFRSMQLGIDPPTAKKLERKKFATKTSIDLMTALFPASQAQKLKEVCRKMGIVPLAGYEMSGDKVLDLVDAGDWDGIARYVHSDAVIEFELYNRLNQYQVF